MARLRPSPLKNPTPSKQRSRMSTTARIKSGVSSKTILHKSPHISKHVSFAYAAGDRRSSHGTRGVHDATNDDEGGDTDGNSDSEATEDWEDGTTLFSGIMETDSLSHPDTVDNNLRLVENLQRPFSLRGEQIKQDLGDILVPTLNRIKEVHARVDEQNNARFQQAALDFQSASDEITHQTRNLKREFEKEAAESQGKIKEFFYTLQRLYKQREDALEKYKENASRLIQEIQDDLVEYELQVEEDAKTAMKQAKSVGTDKKREKEFMKLALAELC